MISSAIIAAAVLQKLRMLDLPMALLALAGGIACIALRKQQAVARQQRVEKGELSEADAKKNGKIFYWCGYLISAGGVFLLLMWMTGR